MTACPNTLQWQLWTDPTEGSPGWNRKRQTAYYIPIHGGRSVSVSCRVILWADNQTPSLLCSAINRLNNINQFLLIFQHPIQLVIITCSKICAKLISNSPFYYHLKANIPHIICLFLKKNIIVIGSYNSYIALKSFTSSKSHR